MGFCPLLIVFEPLFIFECNGNKQSCSQNGNCSRHRCTDIYYSRYIFLIWRRCNVCPLTIEIFGEVKMTYRKAAAPITKIILCLLFKITSFSQSIFISVSYFSILFISRSTTLTISNNFSLVNIPFSISNRIRASCWTSCDIRSSSRERICFDNFH